MWGLIKSVKKGGLLLILGIETTHKGQVWTCLWGPRQVHTFLLWVVSIPCARVCVRVALFVREVLVRSCVILSFVCSGDRLSLLVAFVVRSCSRARAIACTWVSVCGSCFVWSACSWCSWSIRVFVAPRVSVCVPVGTSTCHSWFVRSCLTLNVLHSTPPSLLFYKNEVFLGYFKSIEYLMQLWKFNVI